MSDSTDNSTNYTDQTIQAVNIIITPQGGTQHEIALNVHGYGTDNMAVTYAHSHTHTPVVTAILVIEEVTAGFVAKVIMFIFHFMFC